MPCPPWHCDISYREEGGGAQGRYPVLVLAGGCKGVWGYPVLVQGKVGGGYPFVILVLAGVGGTLSLSWSGVGGEETGWGYPVLVWAGSGGTLSWSGVGRVEVSCPGSGWEWGYPVPVVARGGRGERQGGGTLSWFWLGWSTLSLSWSSVGGGEAGWGYPVLLLAGVPPSLSSCRGTLLR